MNNPPVLIHHGNGQDAASWIKSLSPKNPRFTEIIPEVVEEEEKEVVEDKDEEAEDDKGEGEGEGEDDKTAAEDDDEAAAGEDKDVVVADDAAKADEADTEA